MQQTAQHSLHVHVLQHAFGIGLVFNVTFLQIYFASLTIKRTGKGSTHTSLDVNDDFSCCVTEHTIPQNIASNGTMSREYKFESICKEAIVA